MPLYRYQHRCVLFVHVPKCGGTSIESGLVEAGARQALGDRRQGFSQSAPQHMHAAVWVPWIGDFADWKFAVVRNPYARFISEYRFRVFAQKITDSIDTFATSAMKQLADSPYALGNHLRPQVEFVTEDVEVFRFENGLDQPLKAAFRELGVDPVPTPHQRSGIDGDYRMAPATASLIAERYAADFEAFGYEPADRQSYVISSAGRKGVARHKNAPVNDVERELLLFSHIELVETALDQSRASYERAQAENRELTKELTAAENKLADFRTRFGFRLGAVVRRPLRPLRRVFSRGARSTS